jgi:transcriptional regulator with XRE-family HTH domain
MELTTEAKARAKVERDEELVRVGARVRELRRERGLTQKQLSDEAGLHRVNLNKLENGRADLGISRVRALAQALGVEPGRLFE